MASRAKGYQALPSLLFIIIMASHAKGYQALPLLIFIVIVQWESLGTRLTKVDVINTP